MTINSNFQLVYSTFPDEETAKKIASILLSEQLIACANLLPNMISLYQWKGSLETSQEVVMIAKTTLAHVEEIMTKISALHPYECPCIITLPLQGGHPPFLQWIEASLSPSNL